MSREDFLSPELLVAAGNPAPSATPVAAPRESWPQGRYEILLEQLAKGHELLLSNVTALQQSHNALAAKIPTLSSDVESRKRPLKQSPVNELIE